MLDEGVSRKVRSPQKNYAAQGHRWQDFAPRVRAAGRAKFHVNPLSRSPLFFRRLNAFPLLWLLFRQLD